MSTADDTRWTSKTFHSKSFSLYNGVDVDSLLKVCQEASEAMKSGEWKNIYLNISEEYGSYEVEFRGQRKETEDERAAREKHEQVSKAARRNMYEQLKKEFESTLPECTCREKQIDKTNCPRHREFGSY